MIPLLPVDLAWAGMIATVTGTVAVLAAAWVPILAVTDVVWTGLIVAVTGAITTLVGAWMSTKNTNALNEAERNRKLAEEARIRDAQALEEKSESVRKTVEAKAIVDADKIDRIADKLDKTHDVVNSRVEEFEKALAAQSQITILEFKEMLAKAAAFDSAALAKAGLIAAQANETQTKP